MLVFKNCRFVKGICIYPYTLTLNLNPNFFKPITTLILTTIARTEKEWAVIANKYKYRIDIDEAIKDKLVEFIETIIYLTQDLIDNNL